MLAQEENRESDERENRESSATKIFVGNVPFQCMMEEFQKCFEGVPGFVSAEIVTRHNSPYSRGFGFVTLRTPEDAQRLLRRTDICFKDRVLRFTEYNFQDKTRPARSQKNYLFIKNVSPEMSREQLKRVVEDSSGGSVGACFINTDVRTGESRGNAVVEIKENDIFERVLTERLLHHPDGKIFEVTRWKNKVKGRAPQHAPLSPVNHHHRSKSIDSKEIYRIAFNAGVNVGRLEGLRLARSK